VSSGIFFLRPNINKSTLDSLPLVALQTIAQSYNSATSETFDILWAEKAKEEACKNTKKKERELKKNLRKKSNRLKKNPSVRIFINQINCYDV
jgi:hypothetical protein